MDTRVSALLWHAVFPLGLFATLCANWSEVLTRTASTSRAMWSSPARSDSDSSRLPWMTRRHIVRCAREIGARLASIAARQIRENLALLGASWGTGWEELANVQTSADSAIWSVTERMTTRSLLSILPLSCYTPEDLECYEGYISLVETGRLTPFGSLEPQVLVSQGMLTSIILTLAGLLWEADGSTATQGRIASFLTMWGLPMPAETTLPAIGFFSWPIGIRYDSPLREDLPTGLPELSSLQATTSRESYGQTTDAGPMRMTDALINGSPLPCPSPRFPTPPPLELLADLAVQQLRDQMADISLSHR